MTVRNAQQVPFVSQFMRRRFIARSAAALSVGTSVGALANPAVAPASQPDTLIAAAPPAAAAPRAGGTAAIRPFRISVPRTKLDDLRRRIAATQWPEKETVDGLPAP